MRRVIRIAATICVVATIIVLTTGTLVPLSAQTANAAKRPFTFEDMMALKRVGDPVISPDGRWVMFSAVDVDLKVNKKTSHLWIVPFAGGEARQITSDAAGESRGRWSPDGRKFLFVSGRDGSSQVWVGDFDSASGSPAGHPKKITSISTEADGALWFPDGKSILFTSEVYQECNGDDACNKAKDEERASSKTKAMIFDRLFYRHWNHYTNFKRSHLFVASVEGGAARDLTPGDHAVPPFSLGGQDDYAISPDGQEVAFTSNHDDMEAISTNNDIFVVPAAGGAAKKLSISPGSDSTPLYSPDGKFLAWRTQSRAGYESSSFRMAVYDRRSGEIRVVTEMHDGWVESMVWSPDSRDIYFTSENKGEIPIFRVSEHLAAVDRKPGAKPLSYADQFPISEIARGANDELSLSRDGKTLVFTRMSARAPNEVYKLDIGGREAVPLTHLNDAVLSQVSMQPVESFWFTGAELAKVQGFLIKPPDFDPQKKYPMKFLIHGGPQGQWGDEWSYRWNAELFAASGYVVVMINPRGSTGYGQQFIDGINGDWGGKPFVDLMKGLDHVERSYSFVDKDRECALGASYGGYMINWILGHTNRFKCLVSHDGMFNADSAYGSTEELWFNEWEFKGEPWTNRDTYTKWSPHLYADEFRTPTLVVHGQLDYRLDVSEGFQLFTTLQRLKVPSKMLYFPDEGHWVLKPQNSQLWYKTVNGWVDGYLKKSP
ncbi:MAG TPA: S9 family peptidase [Candidatus Angelobacter sp.]|nr:S9 family peptidase [Candidatus Angelobacter sp.]